MKRPWTIAAALAVVLAAGVAGPAGADPKNEREMSGLSDVEVLGIIVAVHPHERSFVLRQIRRGEDRLWLVRLLPRTRIEFARRGWDDDDRDKFLGTRSLLPLQVGQTVQVEGHTVDGRQILALEITIFRRGFRGPLFDEPRPPFRLPLRAPEILFPQDGAVVSARELVVVGRTVPGARVHIEALTSVAFFHFLAGSADVTAGEDGFFVAAIQPSGVLGSTLRITVQAATRGVTLPTATVQVRLR